MDSSYAALTAHPGGGQALATPIAATYSRFTVGSAGDSAILPLAVPGLKYHVKNGAAANAMNIWPQSTPNPQILGTSDTINGAAVNTAFSLPAGKAVMFFCASPSLWDVIQSAV